MRIVLLTGKGGVGKTTLAAAHAAASARSGHRTLLASMDAAHNLSDLFQTGPAPEPAAVAKNLDICEIDAHRVLAEEHRHLVDTLSSALVGEEARPGEPVLDVPGLEPVFYLLKVRDLARSGAYERIVLDLAPTAETLALLQMPDLLRWWMERIFPVERVATRMLAPVSERLLKIRMPDQRAMDDIERLYVDLREIADLLKDPQTTSVRLVTLAERMVVEETKRSYLYLNLYGYAVDHVFVNGLYSADAVDPFFTQWVAAQAGHLTEIEQAFGHLPITQVPRQPTDITGLAPIEALAETVLTPDCFDVRPLPREEWTKDAGTYRLSLPLPHARREDLTLSQTPDDLVLRVANVQRNIPLPGILRTAEVTSARLDEGTLVVTFSPKEH